MAEYPPNQTAYQRACQETELFRKTGWSFYVWEVGGAAVFGVVGGFIGFWLTPSNTTTTGQFAWPTIGGGLGVIIGFTIVFGGIFVWNLYRAPYRQRDEARKIVKQLTTPLDSTINETIRLLQTESLKEVVGGCAIGWCN